jgi:hypothetical protein
MLFASFVKEMKDAVVKASADYLAAFHSDEFYNFVHANFGPDLAWTISREFEWVSDFSRVANGVFAGIEIDYGAAFPSISGTDCCGNYPLPFSLHLHSLRYEYLSIN